jgi:hypothetical protein
MQEEFRVFDPTFQPVMLVTDRILYAMQLKVGLGDDRLINLRNAPFLLVFHTSWQLVDESIN